MNGSAVAASLGRTSMVTFIVSTYALPVWLGLALRSIQAQERSDWQALVIGDACGPETEAVVDSLDDSRFRYINLPARIGEQAGPNSVGLAIAEGSYVALMNHDDVLLPDHLTIALDTMAAERTNFFVGRSAVAWGTREISGSETAPDFQWFAPANRQAKDVFRRSHLLFEPCSAWVIDRSLAQRVGAWRSSLQGHRPSIQEWLMRAWRSGAQFSFDAPLTCLRFNKNYQSTGGGAYADSTPPPAWFENCLRQAAGSTRKQIVEELFSQPRKRDLQLPRPLPESRLRRAVIRIFVNSLTAELYRRTGWDAFEKTLTLMGSSKGALGSRLSDVRTGFDLARAPTIQSVVEQVVAEERTLANTGKQL